MASTPEGKRIHRMVMVLLGAWMILCSGMALYLTLSQGDLPSVMYGRLGPAPKHRLAEESAAMTGIYRQRDSLR